VSSEEAPPPRADQVHSTPEAAATLLGVAAAVSAELAGAEVLKQQACFLPSSADGLPLIGPVPGVPGAYLATGHSCWGILNAPATGLAVSELIVDGAATTLDLAAFDPGRPSVQL
jgi:glycine/D-amino acid oxidase-like deaminating enzyme